MKRALPGTAGAPDQTSIPDLEAWKQRAVTLATSYERTGDLHLLTQAIELFRKIASAPGLAAADRAGQLGNLVNALALLFERTGDPAVREEALTVARAAVVAAGGRSQQTGILSSLGNILELQFLHTGDLTALEEAIQVIV